MALGDTIQNAAQNVAGKAKEAARNATNNDDLVAEGRTDRAKADVKQAGENVEHAVNYPTDFPRGAATDPLPHPVILSGSSC